ncbi:MAG TPA: class I SAM-dependent methyltransferase [Bryobacteraceae bacterium]|nr:class I SAM-dependent methyltransferase [Bryobacteraceae bacterium]
MPSEGMNPEEFANIAKAEEHFWWYRGQRKILTELLDRLPAVRSARRVLEGGCGTGYMSRFLAERYGWRMTALDLSRIGLEHAKRQGVASLVQGDITQLPVRAGEYDALVSLDVVAHLPEGVEGAAFHEFARVLRHNGLLVLRTSALESLHSRHSQHALERQRFTRRRLAAAIERAGFRVVFASYVNSLLLPLAWFKFRIWEPMFSAAPASGVLPVAPWLNRLLCWPLMMEARWIRHGRSFPLGQTLLLVAEKKN